MVIFSLFLQSRGNQKPHQGWFYPNEKNMEQLADICKDGLDLFNKIKLPIVTHCKNITPAAFFQQNQNVYNRFVNDRNFIEL